MLIELLLALASPTENAAVFDKAWRTAGRRFYDQTLKGQDWDAVRDRFRARAVAAPDDRALYGAVNAMLDTLGDSHTYAISPVERQMNDAAGDMAGGFGLDVALTDGAWRVEGVVPGGPAARAGIEIGWRLVAIDGTPPDGVRTFGAGDRATLRLADDAGVERNYALVGEELPPEPSRRAAPLADRVLLLAFDGFDPGLDRWIRDEIAEAQPTAVILDLRENDGGDAATLDRTAGLFFAEKRTVLRLVRRNETEEHTIGAGREGGWRGPLAVLIGPRSASAAEAFAALIEESGRGLTVGARTAGALTGGTHHRLPDGGSLSVAEWDVRTATGRRLEGSGFPPRVPVAPTLSERRRGEDPAAECARRLLIGRGCATRPKAVGG